MEIALTFISIVRASLFRRSRGGFFPPSAASFAKSNGGQTVGGGAIQLERDYLLLFLLCNPHPPPPPLWSNADPDIIAVQANFSFFFVRLRNSLIP